YTLQMKLLAARRVQNLKPHAVVTLLTMSFRTEWRYLYELLVADPTEFTGALSAAREARSNEPFKLWPGDQTVPRSFLEYVADGPGGAILGVDDLEPYVASVEATRTATRELGPAQSLVVDLGRRIAGATEKGKLEKETDFEPINSAAERLRDSLTYLPSLPAVTRIHDGANALSK